MIKPLHSDTTLGRIPGYWTGKPLAHESAIPRVFESLSRTMITERTQTLCSRVSRKIPGPLTLSWTPPPFPPRERAAFPGNHKLSKPEGSGTCRGEANRVPSPEGAEGGHTRPMTRAGMKRILPRNCSWGPRRNIPEIKEVWQGTNSISRL